MTSSVSQTPFTVGTTMLRTTPVPFTVLSGHGELDMMTAPLLQQALDTAITRTGPRVILELRQVTFCDCRGLGAFAGTHARCRDRGGWLALACPTPMLTRILTLTGLIEYLPVYPTLEAAIHAQPERTPPEPR